ncbi:MAG: redox-sensing transcriptional repressor Rex [Eubacteriales bacterium]
MLHDNINKSGTPGVSNAVINRLPRYYRYLRDLLSKDILRISSGELSVLMNVTASQIRQDLNCFGGFGQQGYGYNVKYLYSKIGDILGVNEAYNAVIIGAGNLGHALAASATFQNRGVFLRAMFDVRPELIGTEISGLPVYDSADLARYFAENKVDIAVLVVPKSVAQDVADQVCALGVKGIWNFTGVELVLPPEIAVQNVHMGDLLMTLCYQIRVRDDETRKSFEPDGDQRNDRDDEDKN